MITAQGARDTSYEEAGEGQFLHHFAGHDRCLKQVFPWEHPFQTAKIMQLAFVLASNPIIYRENTTRKMCAAAFVRRLRSTVVV